jgi:hypothetical protein
MTNGMKNAHIHDTFLGVEDHGLFVLSVGLEYGDGSCQGFQRCLQPDTALAELRAVLHAVGVEAWEQLRGQYCRVVISDGLVRQIGHVVRDDRWTVLPWN